jgi:hypothetical protein
MAIVPIFIMYLVSTFESISRANCGTQVFAETGNLLVSCN